MSDETTQQETAPADNAAPTAVPDSKPEEKSAAPADKKETPAEKAMRQLSEDEYESLMADRVFVDHYVKMEKENPKALLAEMLKMNPDARKAIEDLIIEEEERRVAEESLTPEQRKIRELEAYKKAIEDERKVQEESNKQAMQVQAENEVLEEIKSVIEVGGFDRTPLVAETVRQAIETAIKNNIDYSPEDIADYVHRKFKTTAFGKLSRLQDDSLLDEIGEDMLKRIRAALGARQERLRKAGVFVKGERAPRQEKPTEVAKKLRPWEANREASREAAGRKKSASQYKTPDQIRREFMRDTED